MTITQPVSGAAGAVLSASRRAITFQGPGSSALTYTDVSASDATGRPMPVRLSLRGGAVVISVDVAGARSRRLAPGRYTVLVSAVNSAGLRSPAAALWFTIAR